MCKRYVLLPVAGYRSSSNGSLSYVGSNGNYWSSTVDGTNSRNLNFNSSNANMNSSPRWITFNYIEYYLTNRLSNGAGNRANGNSVRCLKDDT